MANLFFSKPTSEETASLFTDEKIASSRLKIIDWLNDCSGVNKPTDRCEAIKKIQELVVHSEAELLGEFLENVLAFSHDPVQDVRRAVVSFIEELSKSHIGFIPQSTTVLHGLLRDTSPQVIKRVIQSCAAIYKNMLQWLCTLDDISDATEISWNTLCIMKAEIFDMLDHDNDGVRTNAIKFLEGVVILQTYPDEDSMKRVNDVSLNDVPMTMKIVRRRKLEDEAINIFEGLLKMQATSHISSVNLIACSGSLCTIAKMRPHLMAPVVEAIKVLNSNLPPTLSDSQVNSVRKHLKVQFMNILKQPSSIELHATLIEVLNDLGASNQEIQRAIPKLDRKEQARRAKRVLENAVYASTKRMKIDRQEKPLAPRREMEIDKDELEEQKRRAIAANESALLEQLKNQDKAIDLVLESMQNLPNDMPQHFMKNYAPVVNLTIQQRVAKVGKTLAEVMTAEKLGPGASMFTKDPPMRMKVSAEEEKFIVMGVGRRKPSTHDMEILDDVEDDERTTDGEPRSSKEEAQKKLRENMDRVKREQSIIPRMKQKAKDLKLQEITKPISKSKKEQFLVQAIRRILRAEKQSITGGVASQRQKILTVVAATFTSSTRDAISGFILDDITNRLELAFSWLYEEYSLLQGFTRHSYIKSENKPDFAYNKLLNDLIQGVIENADEKLDKESILRKIYHEAPIISDDAFNQLVTLCKSPEYSDFAMQLLTELIIRRQPKKHKYLEVLLKFSVHEHDYFRSQAIDSLIKLYAEHKILNEEIVDHACLWVSYLQKAEPQMEIFGAEYGREETAIVWTESLVRNCMAPFLALMPYHEQLLSKLSEIYATTSAEIKRIILRSIDWAIKKMGAESFQMLKFIEECPKGTETLITRIIHILAEKTTPNPELVKCVRELHRTKISDVRVLIPILNELTKAEILNALPKFLKLNPSFVKDVFTRLLGIGQDFESRSLTLSATELLVALHTLDVNKIELKYVVNAITICLNEKDCYTQDILAIVLQQLVEITPLPTLVMRTILQSLSLYPRMSTFVTKLLQRLIPKQVWKQKILWDGFLKCCQRLRPSSFPVMLTLPPQHLQDALQKCPELRNPLIEFANEAQESQTMPVSKLTMDILLGNSQDIFITEVSGPVGAPLIPLENIKTEMDATNVDAVGQPLPPGEDR